MREEELTGLVDKIQKRKTEFQTIELKAAEKGFPARIYDTLSSFSNQDDGGVIIFGISERQGYNVVGVYDVENAQRKATEACEQMEPPVRAVFTTAEIDGKFILAAEIPPVEHWLRPVFYKGAGRLRGSFVRVGDADEPMNEYEVYSYEAFRRRTRDELRTVPECRPEMLDRELLAGYLTAVKREHDKLGRLSDPEILDLMGVTSGGVPTVAGVLAFSLFPQTWFPQLCITAVSVPGTEIGDTDSDGARFLDNKRITGTIPEMLDSAVDFVRRNMHTKTIIDKDGRRADRDEYPIIAIREAILNALVHRDYSILTENTPITVEMYRDRIEISSKGSLYGGGTVSRLGKGRPETRNPALANILELLKVTENRYSGIPTILKAFEDAALPAPVFSVTHGVFKVTFYNGTGYQTPYSAYTAQPTHSEISEAVVRYCATPKSRADLVSFTQKSRYYTMSAIVQPLVDQGLLRMTIPEKPKSVNQRYVAAE